MKSAAPILPGLPGLDAAVHDLPLWERLVFDALCAAADAGRHAPTASELEAIVGCTNSTTVNLIHRLERKKLIRVQRYQRGRRITILSTGKATADVTNKTPHWRFAGRPDSMPAVSPRVIQQRESSFHERMEAAAKAERVPLTDFMRDLMWAGWCHRERSIQGQGSDE